MEKSTLQADNIFQKKLRTLLFSVKGRMVFLSVILMAFGVAEGGAQRVASQLDDSVATVKEPFRNKIGIRTNVVDWLFTIPNLGFEMEVGKSKYYRNPYTLSLVGRYNWDAWSRYSPSMVFNVADIRIEGRKYWNTVDMNRTEAQETRDSMSYAQYLWKYAFKMDRLKPRKERGYYAGVYLGYHNYSIKLGSTGKQGMAFSGGVTAGFTIPLYAYRNRYIDLDLGGSLGLFYGKYDEYGYDAESDCYPVKAKGKSVVLPWVTELRVALVYRFETVRKKTLTDKQGRQDRLNDLQQRRTDRDKAREHRRDSLALVQKAKELKRDSAKQARQAEKALKALQDSIESAKRDSVRLDRQLQRALQDSIESAKRDSIKLDRQLQRALRDSIENAQKDSIKLARQLEELVRDSIKAAKKRAEEESAVSADSAQVEEEFVPDNRSQEPLTESGEPDTEDETPTDSPEGATLPEEEAVVPIDEEENSEEQPVVESGEEEADVPEEEEPVVEKEGTLPEEEENESE